MADLVALESAIVDAEGASAVLSVFEDDLNGGRSSGWRALGLEPRDDLTVAVMSPTERRALAYASRSLQSAVAEVSRVFYAAGRAQAS